MLRVVFSAIYGILGLILSRSWYCFDCPMRKGRHQEISISVHEGRQTGDRIGEKLQKLQLVVENVENVVLFGSPTIG